MAKGWDREQNVGRELPAGQPLTGSISGFQVLAFQQISFLAKSSEFKTPDIIWHSPPLTEHTRQIIALYEDCEDCSRPLDHGSPGPYLDAAVTLGAMQPEAERLASGAWAERAICTFPMD